MDIGITNTEPVSALSGTTSAAEQPAPAPPAIRSEELLQGQVEVLISHGSETYRLRRTRSGKLILQK